MNKKEIKEFEKRYDKFKNCNLPTPFWDKERKTLEYVYFDDENLRIDYYLSEALGDIALTGFYYSFTSGYMTGNTTEGFRYEVGHNHAHNFEEVVRWLYDYPESFSISKDEEEFYSKQELNYLRDVKEYLLFIGMKDKKEGSRSTKRFKNKKQEEYKHYGFKNVTKETENKILSGKKNYFVIHTEYPDIYSDYKEYNAKEKIDFVRGKNGKILALLEYTLFEKMLYKEFKNKYKEKDIKNYYTKEELQDDDYVIIYHFNVINKY